MLDKLNWRALVVWIALIGLFSVVAGYFVFHKPITPDLTINLFGQIWKILISAGIISLAGGIGARFLPQLKIHPLALVSLQAAFGAGCLALGVLVFGASGLLYPWLAMVLLLLLGVIFHKGIRAWWSGWRTIGLIWSSSSRFGRLAACFIFVILVSTLITALAPPLKFDALVYHLTLPKIYIDLHRTTYIPQIMYWGMPQTAEMLYTWGMMLAGLSCGPVLGWMAGLIALLGVLGFTAQKLGSDAGWMGVASLGAGYTLAASLGWGYADWWTILFGCSFFICIAVWVEQKSDGLLALAGIFAGFAVGTKYTAGILLLCGVTVVLLSRRASIISIFRSLFWFGAPALMVCFPWLVKNFLASGNLFYPLIFPGGEMTPARLTYYQAGPAWGNWLDIFLLPLRATILGAEGGPGYSTSIGPLLLGLSLAAGLGWRSRSESEKSTISLALKIVLTGFLIWMVVGRFSSYLLQSRLYLSIFPAWAFLAAAGYLGFTRFVQHSVRLGVIVSCLVLLVLGLNAMEVSLQTLDQNAGQQILGLQTDEEYLSGNLGWYSPAMQHLKTLPSGSRVLMLFEPRSLYCQPVCEPDEILDRWLRVRYENRSTDPASADEILRQWKDEGYTHILYYKLGADFLRKEDHHYQIQDWEVLEDLLSELDIEKNFGDTHILYRLIP